MTTDSSGQRMFKMKSTILFYLSSIVVVNIFTFILLPFYVHSTREILGDDQFKIIMIINFFEAATLISTILLTISTTKKESVIYFVILGMTVGILILNLALTFKAINHVRQYRPPKRYFRVIAAVYFAFKIFAPFGILRLGMKSNVVVDGTTVFYIRNNDDVEILVDNPLGLPVSPAPPPSYEQCIASEPPPPYKDANKDNFISN